MEPPAKRPPLFRRGSSTLSIEHDEFVWLKKIVTSEQHGKDSPGGSPAIAAPSLPATPVSGKKHGHNEDDELSLVAMSPGMPDDDDDDDDAPPSTGASKRRRKIGWTNTEDLTILAAVRRIGTQWQRIADNLPGRTADAVRNRWHRLQRSHALNDTEEGRSALDGLLISSGVDPNWLPPELAEAGGGAPVAPVRGADHGRAMWTAEEDRIIEDGVRRLGCKWRQISGLLPNRTDSSVRNRWMRLCKEAGSRRESEREASLRELSARSEEGGPPADRRSETEIVEALTSSLKASLEVERLPLGLDAPNLVVDLDAFAEAVSACVYTDDGDVEPFGVQHTAELRAQPPDGRAVVHSEHAPPFKLKLASAALATLSAVPILSSVTNRSRA